MDVLGERWSLLVLRELSLGPRRYGDLADSLPGIGTNLLAARLRSLEAAGVLRRIVLPAPANVPAYELTERGEQLQPVLEDLALWGFELLPDRPAEGDAVRASWAALTMSAELRRAHPADLRGTFAFAVGDERFQVSVDDSGARLCQGVPDHADVTLTSEPGGFLALATMQDTPSRAAAGGRVTIDGDPALMDRLFASFHLPARPEPAPESA